MPTLYHCAQSRGLRPLWLIEEMGIDCDLIVYPYPARSTNPEFLEINPLGTVPYLVDGETSMTESMAISTYLATRYGPSLLVLTPADAEYGNCLDLVDYGEATLMMALAVRVRLKVTQADLGFQAAGDLYGERFVCALAHIEKILSDDREFLCAARLTLADISVAYALYLARLTGLGDRLPPHVVAYADRIFARPAFVRARKRESIPGG